MRATSAVAFTSLVTLALAAGPAAQQVTPGATTPNPSTISLDVVVTDAAGRPVTGLQAGDFEIREDGKPMPIDGLTPVDLSDAGAVGRTYLIVVDSLHLSVRGAMRVRPLLEQFITEHFGPHDRAAVLVLGPSPAISPLMNDRQQLLRAIGAADKDARTVTAAGQPELGFGAIPTTPADYKDAGVRGYTALRGAIDRVGRDATGRVGVLFVSEGVPLSGPRSRDTVAAQRACFAAAAREHVAIYPINPAGAASINSGLSPSEEFEPAGLEAWDSLRALADHTGGRATLAGTDMSKPYREIVQDTSTYYILTYRSPHAGEHDGDFHGIQVSVKRKAVKVTARKGWFEPGIPNP